MAIVGCCDCDRTRAFASEVADHVAQRHEAARGHLTWVVPDQSMLAPSIDAVDVLDTAQGSVELGGSVETFADTAAAQARADYIAKVMAGSPAAEGIANA